VTARVFDFDRALVREPAEIAKIDAGLSCMSLRWRSS
jgi:hypothetical protein